MQQVVLYFTAYDEVKQLLGYHELTNPNPFIPVISGGLARIITVTAVSPIELLRTKIQSEKLNYTQLVTAVRTAVQQNGFISLYSGWVPTILRDVPFSMIYWFSYEKFKTFSLRKIQKDRLTSWQTFLCGATAGSIAAAITCPFDVVKTHRQIQLGEKQIHFTNKSTLFIINDIIRKKGYKALFSG